MLPRAARKNFQPLPVDSKPADPADKSKSREQKRVTLLATYKSTSSDGPEPSTGRVIVDAREGINGNRIVFDFDPKSARFPDVPTMMNVQVAATIDRGEGTIQGSIGRRLDVANHGRVVDRRFRSSHRQVSQPPGIPSYGPLLGVVYVLLVIAQGMGSDSSDHAPIASLPLVGLAHFQCRTP